MNRSLLLGSMIALLLTPLSARGALYTIYTDQDSWLKQAAPDENHGNDYELACKSVPADSFRAVFRYDLSSIPAGEKIITAMAVFYVSAPDFSGFPVNIFRITDSWTESGVTWANTADDYENSIKYGSFVPAPLGLIAVDITPLVQEWKEGIHPNEGLMLISSSFNFESKFSSKEWFLETERPRLMVLTDDGPMQMASGRYLGNGFPGLPITNVGFQPDFVLVQGNNGLPTVARSSTMFGDVSKKLGTAEPLIGNAIQSFHSDGFTVGWDPHVNSPGVTYYWTAFRASVSQMRVDSYPGDGFDNRSIPGVGFQPDYVIIMNENTSEAVHRFSSQSGDATLDFGWSGESTNRIQAFEPDGFQIGSDTTVNQFGARHHYVAWKSTAGRIAGNTYSGTGFDNENIFGVGFQPEYLIIRSEWMFGNAVHRSASFPGDATMMFDSGFMFGDAIQTFLPDGFQLGQSMEVNTAGTPYHWVAFRGGTALDLALSKDVDTSNPCEGDTISYTISVINNGPADAAGISVGDSLPPGVSYLSDSSSQGSYSSINGIWSVGDLTNGAKAELNLKATVDAGTGGSEILNTAVLLAADQPDTTNSNNLASVSIFVQNTDFRVKTGSYLGDGFPNRSITEVGFRPDLVFIKGDNNEPSIARSSTMVGAVSKELGTNTPLLGNLITSLDALGFTIGSGIQVNDAGVMYYWTAFQAAPGFMKTGRYVGDENDNRSIKGVGFEPAYVVVMAAHNEDAMQRFASEVFDKSLPFDADDEKGDRIQDFEPDGFQIGKHNTVNERDSTYHYIAWNSVPERIAESIYLGNKNDNHNIKTPGFRPEYLIVTRQTNGSPAVHRPNSLLGDNTLPVNPGGTFEDGIQMFLPDGFQVGLDDAVNKSSETYFWVAFRDIATLDLALSKTVSDSFPNEGDTLSYTITLINNGPDDATAIDVRDLLPTGVTYISHRKSQGSYSQASGFWDVGDMVVGEIDSLTITATVNNGTAGSVITNEASITAADQADIDASNDIDYASSTVQSADLSISKAVDSPIPNIGDTLTYTVTLRNNGPHAATNVNIMDLLPPGLVYHSDSTSAGNYASGTGLWSIGSVAVGDSATLILIASVDAGIGDSTIINSATVASADQADPDSTNNTGLAGIDVLDTDLKIEKRVDVTLPFEGDTLTYTVTLVNLGPDDATGIEVFDILPAGLTYVSDTTSSGVYESVIGLWTVGGLVYPDTATLEIYALVDSGTVDSVITNTASISAVDQRDTYLSNNSDSTTVTVAVPPSILDSHGSLYPSSVYAETPNFALRIGADNTSTVGVMLDTTSTISFTDGPKVYSAKLANPSYLPPLADNFTITFREAPLPVGFTAPASYDLLLILNGIDDHSKSFCDTISTAGRNSLFINVPYLTIQEIELDVETAFPGSGNLPLLAMEFLNPYMDSRALDTLVVTNASIGPGTIPELDAEFDALYLFDDVDSSSTLSISDTLVSTSTFIAGRAVFQVAGDWEIAGGSRRSLFVTADIDSFLARDGDRLDAVIFSPLDVVFTDSTQIADTFSPLDPINSFGFLLIDGMISFQITLFPGALDTLVSGTENHLLLTMIFPQNGYEPDTLTALSIYDLAGDFSPDDFSALRLFVDTGDLLFDPLVDQTLGEMVYSGDRFEISGVSVPVGPSIMFFVCADISTTPVNGSHFRPAIPLDGVEVVSQNDGPIDQLVAADTPFVFKRIEKIEVTSLPVPSIFPRPGEKDVSLLLLSIKNNTIQPVTLDSLMVSNTSVGPRSIADLDGEISELKIYRDDGNGALDSWDELLLDSLVFSNGSLVARGIDNIMSPGELDHLLFVCDIDSFCSRDGDTLRLQIPSAASLYFDPAKPVIAEIPLETEGTLVIDGMVAFQIEVFPPTDSLLITATSDILVFDFAFPANGYESDTLESIEILNEGSATSEHFARLAFYTDGGNGVFDSGTGDDLYMGDFFDMGGKEYLLPGLAVPLLEACGSKTRFYVVADLRTDFTNGASIQFKIPVNGILVASGNDGPIDVSVTDPSIRLIPRPNELTVFPYTVGDKRVYPGASKSLNFGIGFYNGYSSSFFVEKITLSQSYEATALNGEIDAVFAYEDSDTNGLFDPASDSLLSAGFYDNFNYILDNLDLELKSKRVTYLYISYDLNLNTRDSVSIDLLLNSSDDLTLSSPSIDIIGEFPVNSPGIDFSDGMTSTQIILDPVPEYRAAPGDEDILAMAFRIPSNGSLSDVLQSIAITNEGTALEGIDITTLKLWKESGGDPLRFSPAEDQLVSFLTWNGSMWRNPAELSEVILAPGLRCYVTFSVSNTATDGASFLSVIPIDGIQMDSGNDGPLDEAVKNTFNQTISTDPLQTHLSTNRSTYSVGQTISLFMDVRNTGTTPITNISPSTITTAGSGSTNYQSGPSFDSFNLLPDGDTTVVWTYTATTSGTFNFCGFAYGNDSTEVSESSCTDWIELQNKPQDISVDLTDTSPTSANRGQENVRLFKLRCFHTTSDTLSASVLFDKIILGFEDEFGVPIPPGNILESVTLANPEGGQQVFTLVDTTSNPIPFTLVPPTVIPSHDSLTLDFFCKISDSASFTPFRLSLNDLTNINIFDSNDSSATTLSSPVSFPWLTNEIAINSPADTLFASCSGGDTVFANISQNDVSTFELELLNGGDPTASGELLTDITFCFYDTSGTSITPNSVIRKLSLASNEGIIYTNENMPVTDNRFSCDLGSHLLLHPQNKKYLDVLLDMKGFPKSDGFYLTVSDPLSIVARDINTGHQIEVVPGNGSSGFPLRSSVIIFQSPASGAEVSHTSLLPPTLLPSMQSIPVMNIVITHPDTASASSLELDSLAAVFTEMGGGPLPPGGYFSSLYVKHENDTLAVESSLSSSLPIAEFNIDPPLVISPVASETLEIYLDTKSLYTPVTFNLRIEKDHLSILDSNDHSRIYAISGVFPLVTDYASLKLMSSKALCGLVSRLPANISAVFSNLHVFDLLVQNENPEGSTDIELRSITVKVENIRGSTLDPTQFFSNAYLAGADSVISHGQINDTGISFDIPVGLVEIAAGTLDTLFFTLDVNTQSAGEIFRFVIEDSTSMDIRDAVTGNGIPVGTLGGAGYPLKSGTTHILGTGAQEAFTNYPNPFAAGREETRITYYLNNLSRITLKLYTIWGAPVKTLVSNKLQAPGLYQDIVWNGKNADGNIVNNGVYYLVLEIHPVDGGQSSLKRKVGVIR